MKKNSRQTERPKDNEEINSMVQETKMYAMMKNWVYVMTQEALLNSIKRELRRAYRKERFLWCEAACMFGGFLILYTWFLQWKWGVPW